MSGLGRRVRVRWRVRGKQEGRVGRIVWRAWILRRADTILPLVRKRNREKGDEVGEKLRRLKSPRQNDRWNVEKQQRTESLPMICSNILRVGR